MMSRQAEERLRAVLAKLLRTSLHTIYLSVCAPLVLALVYILPPFQAPDEAAHFYRTIQISHGEMAPLLAPKTYRQGAGGAVEGSAFRLVDRYCGMPNWRCKLQTRPELTGIVDSTTHDEADDPRRVTSFSNTVVYLPVAHVVPAAAIAIVRTLGFPAIGWLYAGRLANALFAIAASWLALRLLRDQRAALLVFATATLPMTTSVFPTLCADSGVISCSLLLLALCVRMLDRNPEDWRYLPLLFIAVLYAAAAKLAYLPLAIMPIGCAVTAKSSRRVLSGTALVAIFTIGITLAWAALIHAYIFSISLDPQVDPARQMANVIRDPANFLSVLMRSMILEAPRAIVMLLGRRLSALNVFFPWALVAMSGVTLVLAIVWSAGVAASRSFRRFALMILFAAACATFAFLYIQSTMVGAQRVQAYQGRYLLPLLPFVTLILPRSSKLAPMNEELRRPIIAALGCLATIFLTLFLALRTWA
jgi:uncharacterized membrane protein